MKPSFLNWTISAKKWGRIEFRNVCSFLVKRQKNNAKGLRFAFVQTAQDNDLGGIHSAAKSDKNKSTDLLFICACNCG